MTLQEQLLTLANAREGQSVGPFRVLQRTVKVRTIWYVWFDIIFKHWRGTLYRMQTSKGVNDRSVLEFPQLGDITVVAHAREVIDVYSDVGSVDPREFVELSADSQGAPNTAGALTQGDAVLTQCGEASS